MIVEPATRNANRWLFVALVVFAIGFCAAILLWMRYRTMKKGGRVYPPPTSWVVPDRTDFRAKSTVFVVSPLFSARQIL